MADVKMSPAAFVAELADLEEPLSVELAPTADARVQAKVGDRLLELAAERIGPHTYSLVIGDRVHEITVLRRKDGSIVYDGATELQVKLTDRRRFRAGAGAAGGAGQREVKAVMPGKVVTILVAVGDEVERDQPLLVLEAMKMENDVKSPRKGKVQEIHVTSGEAVETGELMVTLE